MIEGQKRDKLGRFAYGRAVFGSSGSPRPGRAIPPPQGWTHIYSKDRGGLRSKQGARCKLLNDYQNGLVRIEFEDGILALVRKGSLKALPEDRGASAGE